MKKYLISSWIILSFCAQLCANAQILITQSDMQNIWTPGHHIAFYRGSGSTTLNIGSTGGPNIYDFKTLSYFYENTATVRKISEVNLLSGHFPDSVLTISSASQTIENSPILMFVSDTMLELGFGDVSPLSDTLLFRHYVPPIIDFEGFPFTYGYTWNYTTTSYETTYVKNSVHSARTGSWSANTIVDGYGTLRIPGHEIQCLRVKSVRSDGQKVFYFLTHEGVFFFVTTNTTQPDTGSITAGFRYMLGGSLVNVRYESRLPVDYHFMQNYPNPFNPSTTIEYQIPSQSFVTLKIFDLLGREVETLVNEQKEVGNYSVQWNASSFSSGIYFYQLQSGTFTKTKRLVLLK